MRRIGRYILNGLMVLSLVLCIGMCTFWVRSFHFQDAIVCDGGRLTVAVGSFERSAALYLRRERSDLPHGGIRCVSEATVPRSEQSWRTNAVGWEWHGFGSYGASTVLRSWHLWLAPHWLLVLFAGFAVPFGKWRSWVRTRRRRTAPAAGFEVQPGEGR